jgi:hypothetical protein
MKNLSKTLDDYILAEWMIDFFPEVYIKIYDFIDSWGFKTRVDWRDKSSSSLFLRLRYHVSNWLHYNFFPRPTRLEYLRKSIECEKAVKIKSHFPQPYILPGQKERQYKNTSACIPPHCLSKNQPADTSIYHYEKSQEFEI